MERIDADAEAMRQQGQTAALVEHHQMVGVYRLMFPCCHPGLLSAGQ